MDVAQCKLEELVGQNARSIRKSEKRVVGKDRPEAHSPCVEYRFVAQAAKTCMPMNNFNFLTNDDVAKDWKE